MSIKSSWIEKVIEVFMEEVGDSPKERDEIKLMNSIMTLVQFRTAGLDCRKIGLLAADVYRMVHANRARVVEDIARVAAAESRKEERDGVLG